MMQLSEWQKTLKPKRCLIYNASVQDGHDRWTPFPIGMGYKIATFTGSLEETQIGSHNQDVLCAITTDTDMYRRPNGINRKVIVENLKKNGIENKLIDSSQYFRELPKYRFVISPEGNGIDCHRHYEALMAGCIPIVEKHPAVEEKYHGCPILWTNDYSEITIQYLNQKYEEMFYTKFNFGSLYLQHYPPAIQKQIKENGNYWGRRLTGKYWYT